ncbi:MAG: hypothetical protein AAGE65_03645 [Planctomycetota bacterium]
MRSLCEAFLLDAESEDGVTLLQIDDWIMDSDGRAAMHAMVTAGAMIHRQNWHLTEASGEHVELGRMLGVLNWTGDLSPPTAMESKLARIRRDYAELRMRFAKVLKSQRKRFRDVVAQFERTVATKAAQTYWQRRANQARRRVGLLVLVALGWALSGIAIGLWTGALYLETSLYDRDNRLYELLLKVTLAALPVAVYWAGLRTVVKMLVFQLLVHNDARERETMVQTFEALSESESAQGRTVDPALLTMVVERLTRPSVTGLTRGETVGPLALMGVAKPSSASGSG